MLTVSMWFIDRVYPGGEVLRATRDHRALLGPRVQEGEMADEEDLVPLVCQGFPGSQEGRARQARRERLGHGGRMASRDQEEWKDDKEDQDDVRRGM